MSCNAHKKIIMVLVEIHYSFCHHELLENEFEDNFEEQLVDNNAEINFVVVEHNFQDQLVDYNIQVDLVEIHEELVADVH